MKIGHDFVDCGDRRKEIIAVLKHYLARAMAGEEYTGMMLILEKPEGAYVTAQTGTSNAAERLGRLEFLKLDVVKQAREDER